MILQSRRQLAAVLPGKCINRSAQTLTCQFSLGFCLSLLYCRDHFSLLPFLSSLHCFPSLILSCQTQGDPVQGSGSLSVAVGPCKLLGLCSQPVSWYLPRRLQRCSGSSWWLALDVHRRLASGQKQEAGDLCRSPRQCSGLSCAPWPGPSPVPGWICSLKLTAPNLHPQVCGTCSFLGTRCHGKLPAPLIPLARAAKEPGICQTELT